MTDTLVGTVLGSYEIRRLIGRGGMGVVYEAVEADLGRRVALKVIAPERAGDNEFRRRFVEESRLAASVEHPAVLPIYRAAEVDGVLLIAMRLIDGEDLATIVRRDGPLAPDRAAAIVAQVADALDAAHARRLVHRDVKPANVLVARDGRVYLSDFGLAKDVETTSRTELGQMLGTRDYAAPEQLRAEPVGPWTDVYALGAVLMHLLTGEPPSASERRPDLPSALVPILRRALAWTPSDRWPSATAFANAALDALGSVTDVTTRTEFRILGPFEVRADGRDVALGGDKRRALLAMLALHANEPVSVERLAVALWGEETSDQAIKTVRVHVSRIRSALGAADVLATVPTGYVLRVGAGELDADRFEELLDRGRKALAAGDPARAAELLRAGLSLWRGEALGDLRYEAFAQAAIARLEDLRWDAIEARNDADLALGRAEAVLADLEQRAGEAPLRERLIEQRMRALYAAGRHVEALAVYQEARQRLDTELGLQPGPVLRELERAVLAHDASLRPETPAQPAPPPATTTVGRAQDLATVAAVIADRRLVTLIGPGGVGKTRLATAAARTLADRFPGGVHVAYLARVATAAEVPDALVRAVGMVVQPGERNEDALSRRLDGPETLLVVDNLEHVLDASPLLAELVEACPRLRVLATSREPLRLRAEQCVPVEPLRESDAIALFVRRARERRPDFELTDKNAAAIAELCDRLDGLPLAIELAAGRIGLLEPRQLVERLADALPLLEAGPRDAPARQRTMRATLEWSFALLDRAERETFGRLAVFVGGAEIDAAQAVTDAPIGVLDALATKSLLRVSDGRVRQLEVVRQFAAARTADADAVRARHAEHYLELVERLAARVRVTGRGPELDVLERELGNVRAALDHLLAAGDGERALRLSAALEPYWASTGRVASGAALVDAALALEAGGSERARGRARLARALLRRGLSMHESVQDADTALELCTAAGDLEGRCLALDMVSAHASYFGDKQRATTFAREQRTLADQLGDPFLVALAAMRQSWSADGFAAGRALADEAIPLLRRCGHVRGIVEITAGLVGPALLAGEYEAAADAGEEGLRAAEETGQPMARVFGFGNAALAAVFLERMDRAAQLYERQCEILCRERIEGLWRESATGLACIAAHAGAVERAATLIGFGDAMPSVPEAEGDRLVREQLIARFIAPAQAAVDERVWQRAAAAGARMTADEFLASLLAPAPT